MARDVEGNDGACPRSPAALPLDLEMDGLRSGSHLAEAGSTSAIGSWTSRKSLLAFSFKEYARNGVSK